MTKVVLFNDTVYQLTRFNGTYAFCELRRLRDGFEIVIPKSTYDTLEEYLPTDTDVIVKVNEVPLTTEPFKVKVTIVGEDFGYWTIEDYTDYFEDIAIDNDHEYALAYFRCGRFTEEEVDQLNGKHFLYGYLECLYQSDIYLPALNEDGILEIVVEHVK